jgi:isopenicillin-N epimerase
VPDHLLGKPPEPFPGARLLFSLDPAQAHLNHGSLGAVPLPVQRAQQRLRDEMEGNPQRFFTRGLRDRIAHARRHLATFVGADPDGTALVPNATAGIAVVLRTLGLGTGDEVLVTDHGYGSVRLAIAETGATQRVVAVELDATDDEIVDSVLAAVRPARTKLVIVDVVGSSTAKLFPLARLVRAVRATGVPLLVDGAHGPGLVPLDVSALGADFFVGNLHKWAYAPRGTALLTVAEPWRSRVRPNTVSWGQPDGFPANVEHGGTLDYTPWLAAPTGVFVLRTLGVDQVRAHNADLARYGQHAVGAALGLSADELPDPGAALAIRIVPLRPPVTPGAEPAAAAGLRDRISDELHAEVAVNPWRGRLLLRLSGQVYNRPDEYERLADGLPGLLR